MGRIFHQSLHLSNVSLSPCSNLEPSMLSSFCFGPHPFNFEGKPHAFIQDTQFITEMVEFNCQASIIGYFIGLHFDVVNGIKVHLLLRGPLCNDNTKWFRCRQGNKLQICLLTPRLCSLVGRHHTHCNSHELNTTSQTSPLFCHPTMIETTLIFF